MNLKEIAQALGVSQACVSLVRKGRKGVSAAVRAQVQAALAENGFSYVEYDPDTQMPAGAAAPAPSHCIRLLTYKKHAMLVDGNDGFVTSIINAIDQEARARHYQMLVSVFGPEDYASAIEAAMQTPTDGALLIATEMTMEELHMIDAIALPLVILDSDFIASRHSCVTMNNRALAYAAVGHLLSLGHPRVGYLRSSVATGNFRSRTQGYAEALEAAGLKPEARTTYHLRPTMNGAYCDMRGQLKEGWALPSAFFADNDIIAIGAMKALTEAGHRIPEDISIVGVDNIPFGAVASPPLTTMEIPCAEIGRWAVELLLQTIASPGLHKTKIQVGASLIARASTAPYRRKRQG